MIKATIDLLNYYATSPFYVRCPFHVGKKRQLAALARPQIGHDGPKKSVLGVLEQLMGGHVDAMRYPHLSVGKSPRDPTTGGRGLD